MVVKKRIPTSLKVDPELWQEVKIMAIRVHKNITEYFEDALRERLVKDYEIVAAERKRKEQERLHKEELDQRYQRIINTDPGVDADKVEAEAVGRAEFTLNVPELKFPATKKEIIESAKKGKNTKPIMNALNRIQDRVYDDNADLEEPLKKITTTGENEAVEKKQRFSNIFNKDTAMGLAEGEGEIRLRMPGLEFPINKNKLIQLAKLHDEKLQDHQIEMDSYLPIIEKLPDSNKTYNDVKELGEDVINAVNNNEELISIAEIFNINKVVVCTIDTSDDYKEQQKQEQLKAS